MADDDAAIRSINLRMWEGPVWDRIRAALKKANEKSTLTMQEAHTRLSDLFRSSATVPHGFYTSRTVDPGPDVCDPWLRLEPVKLKLVDTEPGGVFCEGCDGRGCWCQTWEPVVPKKKVRRCIRGDWDWSCPYDALPGSTYCAGHQVQSSRTGRKGTPGKRNRARSSRPGRS